MKLMDWRMNARSIKLRRKYLINVMVNHFSKKAYANYFITFCKKLLFFSMKFKTRKGLNVAVLCHLQIETIKFHAFLLKNKQL
jgi:hypothetical protein